MQWDLGLKGLGLLVAMSLVFGVIAQLVAGRATTRWLWAIASAAYFVGGLFASEVWFGWPTEEELQPNIEGLSIRRGAVDRARFRTYVRSRHLVLGTAAPKPSSHASLTTNLGTPYVIWATYAH